MRCKIYEIVMVRYCLLCLELTDLLMETAAESENEHREPGTPTWLEYLRYAARQQRPPPRASKLHSLIVQVLGLPPDKCSLNASSHGYIEQLLYTVHTSGGKPQEPHCRYGQAFVYAQQTCRLLDAHRLLLTCPRYIYVL